jgi:hypothetical protein
MGAAITANHGFVPAGQRGGRAVAAGVRPGIDRTAMIRTMCPGVAWRTYLHPGLAASFGAPALPQTADEVIRLALAWSAEAGLSPDRDALAETLDAKNISAEDTYDELLAALGIAEFTY